MTATRRSRTESPQDPPLTWHHYVAEDGSPLVAAEVAACVKEAPTHSARIHRYAQIKQRLSAAERGELLFEDELKAVASDPDLWEIRWCLDAQEWRIYHAEPALAPKYLVGLRFHRKSLDGSDEEIQSAQNGEIAVASRRYREGRLGFWGIP